MQLWQQANTLCCSLQQAIAQIFEEDLEETI